jgi:DHA2 family methylenomycin A resistance protein-like MFS transporter
LTLTAGPLVGGSLIALEGWRSIFFVNLPIGLVGLWLTSRYASETTRSPQREIDLPGQVAAIAALGCLAAAIIEGGAPEWTDPFVMAGFVASAVLAALFILREQHAAQPMLPLKLFRHPMFALASLVGLLVNVAFYGLIFVFSLYFQRVNGWSAFATGLAFLPMMGAVLPVNLVAAGVAERIGAPRTIALGAVLAAAGCLALLGIAPGTSYTEIGAQLVIIGGGLGLLVPPLTSTLLASVDKSRSGVAAGVLNSTRQTGSVLGVALFGSLVGGPNAFMPGAHQSLVISALLLVVAGAAVWSGAGPAS